MSVLVAGFPSRQLAQGQKPRSERKLDNVTPLFKNLSMRLLGDKITTPLPFLPGLRGEPHLSDGLPDPRLATVKDTNGREKWHLTSRKRF